VLIIDNGTCTTCSKNELVAHVSNKFGNSVPYYDNPQPQAQFLLEHSQQPWIVSVNTSLIHLHPAMKQNATDLYKRVGGGSKYLHFFKRPVA
jgi:hypothetical protein